MRAGSAMLYVGSLWHGGGANTTGRPRLGVAVEYVAAWLRPQETQLLAVPHRASATTALDAADGAVLRRAGVAGEA